MTQNIIPQKPPPPPRREMPHEPLDPSDPAPRVPEEVPVAPQVPPSQRPTPQAPSNHHVPRRDKRRSFPPPPPDVRIIDRAAQPAHGGVSGGVMLLDLGGGGRPARSFGAAAPSVHRSR